MFSTQKSVNFYEKITAIGTKFRCNFKHRK